MNNRICVNTYRRVTPTDKDEWLRLRLALWPTDYPNEHLQEMEEILADVNSPVFVAQRADGSLGGFLEAGMRNYADACDSSPVGYIEGWYVDPDLRQQGVGAQLVAAAEEWARSLGLLEMASDTWLDNEISQQVHAALGYEETERLVHFRKKNMILQAIIVGLAILYDRRLLRSASSACKVTYLKWGHETRYN